MKTKHTELIIRGSEYTHICKRAQPCSVHGTYIRARCIGVIDIRMANKKQIQIEI